MTRILPICLCAFLLAPVTSLADPDRFAVIIGNNTGLADSEPLRYAVRDARKMHDLLIGQGGFDAPNTILLVDQPADAVWQALKQIEQAARRRSEKTGSNTMLLLYFSGHAEGAFLELAGTTIPFSRLRRFLVDSKVPVRLAFIDSCHSGALISTRGASRGRNFDIRVNDAVASRGYAIITSSAGNELSQESRELRGAFFTHHLTSALRGQGDANGDGLITLQEAYRYAYARTLSFTTENVGISQHPMYDFELKGRGEIVLTRLKTSMARIEVPFLESGRLLLQDGAGETILAEAELVRGESTWFSVPPGDYRLFIVKGNGAVRLAEFAVESGTTTLRADDFASVALEESIARGGLFRLSEQRWSHRLGAGGLWRSGPLNGMMASFGGVLHYRLRHRSGIEPQLRLTTAMAKDAGLSTGYRDLGASLGTGHAWKAGGLYLRAYFLLGYEHMFQSPRYGHLRHTSSFAWSGNAGVELPVGAFYFALDAGAGGRMFQVTDKGWVHRIDFAGMLSAGWRWETR